jgi:SPP1 gp7 family putative phage head morphogenesis protein
MVTDNHKPLLKCGKCKQVSLSKQFNETKTSATYYCFCCNAKNIILKQDDEDYSVQEWLGFDYREYLASIISAINKDNFGMLQANNAMEVKAGKLSGEKIDILKDILKDNFIEGNNLSKIAADIERKIKPKDLFKMNDDGTIKLINGEPVIAISKEYRSAMIARSETTRMAAEGSINFYKEKGVEEVKWVSSFGMRTCPTCEELNGMVYEINDAPRPPVHSNCRCTIVAIQKEG